ncbi:cell wall-binding repeat-containing protein [Herbiconiux sp. CPCC 205763]|uniref:Cell wall-binding repeat-containing protein n=1 Tax=Herbiconiux aconitum TaxID=2970913 RepID=A0ABT2GLQ6_9MICO|nr:cell wall-binding repeat-containing protein [Herbiconiux aconitum]MCS5717051.1 cell wall-binding repeat-containing protein [Herbiconiux aconitum]
MSRRTHRASLLGALTVAVVLGASVSVPLSAQALQRSDADASAAVSTTPTGETDPQPEPTPDSPIVMGDYPLQAYAADAAVLPVELADAIQADLSISPEEYLARAEAAATAADVVDELNASGTSVLASRMEGTQLVVTVGSDAEIPAVEAVGATAEIGAAAERTTGPSDFSFLKDLVGGQGYYTPFGDGGYRCSVGFNGRDKTNASRQFLTAGHCYEPSSSSGGSVYELMQSAPGGPYYAGAFLASPVSGSAYLGNGYDASVYSPSGDWTLRPAVGTWNNNQGPVTSGTPITVRDYTKTTVGQVICKSGSTTGWTCGTVDYVDAVVDVDDHQINSYISGMCALPGDSGGAVVSGNYAVGLLSAGSYQSNCNEPGQETASVPIDSVYESVLDVEPNFEFAVEVAKPTSSTIGGGVPLYRGNQATGYLPSGGTRFTVHLTVDGSHEYTIPVAANATWSANIAPDLANGSHSFSMYASYGSGTDKSGTTTGTFQVADRPTVDRIEGATRFDVAVSIADKAYPTTAPVVYVATGLNYPDALSAGPAAVKQGGPLLLVWPDSVPQNVADKISSLDPDRVVIVGGTASVNAGVEETLKNLVPDAEVERLSGADRYEASRNVVESAFDTGSTHAYAATGANFPDALSAGGAAGSKGEPVTLVYGPAPTADSSTISMFKALGTNSLTVVGGTNSVSTGLENSLRTGIPATVDRVAGSDRFQASINLNRSAFTSATTVYLATGLNFPDALAGGVLAGKTDGPLYVVPGDCVPRGVLADVATLGATKVTLLGGPNSLSPAVQNLVSCAW